MTALKQYARLETAGLWRAAPDAQAQNVVVAFGDASLVISEASGRILSHWSLAAVERVNPGKDPALYAPSAEAGETLEIDDADVIDAIEQVRSVVARTRPRQGWLRGLLLWGTTALVLGAAALWLPGALRKHTVRAVPDPVRAEVGSQLFTAITRLSGAPCGSPRGDSALAKLHGRLSEAPGGLLILPAGVETTLALPGDLMLLNRSLVEDHESPDVLAGYMLAEFIRTQEQDPLDHLLDHAGLRATFRLLTTGALDRATLDAYAEDVISVPRGPVADDALLTRFAAARVPSTPYAYARDLTGETVLPLIEADPMRAGGASEVLADADWVALQGICGE